MARKPKQRVTCNDGKVAKAVVASQPYLVDTSKQFRQCLLTKNINHTQTSPLRAIPHLTDSAAQSIAKSRAHLLDAKCPTRHTCPHASSSVANHYVDLRELTASVWLLPGIYSPAIKPIPELVHGNVSRSHSGTSLTNAMEEKQPQTLPMLPEDLHQNRTITIIGTGLMGRALAAHIRAFTNFSLVVTSRSLSPSPAEAVQHSSIVILAVPSHSHGNVLQQILPALQADTLLIDISNRPLRFFPSKHEQSIAQQLQAMVPKNVYVVKAFNTLSAQQLAEVSLSGSSQISVPFACSDQVAGLVSNMISDFTFTPRYLGGIEDAAKELESMPHKLFPRYKYVLVLSAVVWAWWILYSLLSTYIIHGRRGKPSRPWSKAPLSVFMATTGETAMTLFAITFLAGPVARIWQVIRGSTSKRFVPWFEKWLDARKELGLVAFVFVSAHGIAGAISASHKTDGWKGQMYFVFGIISYMMFAVLALCSGSSIANSLSWAEFRAVFSWLGTWALVFGVLHQGFWGWILKKHRPNPSYWVGNGAIMPIYWLGIILPLVALTVRLITWSPCISVPLKRLSEGVYVEPKKEPVEV